MTHNIIFSIFIDIPEDKLDNPGWYEKGVQVKTDKSLNTKNALYNNRHELETVSYTHLTLPTTPYV